MDNEDLFDDDENSFDGEPSVAGGFGDDEEEECVEHFALSQHPRAKKIQKDFNPQHCIKDLTVAEKIHFDSVFSDIKFYMFFDGDPVSHRNWYNFLQHNIRVNVLYELNKRGEITLSGFDATAALSSLKVSHNKEVLVPSIGAFVITSKDGMEAVINLERHPNSMEWTIYYKDSVEYGKWNKMLRKAMKEYNQYKNKVFDQIGNFIDLPQATFEDIFLDDKIRDAVKTNIIDYVDDQKIELKKKNGIPTRRGIIFTGVPGTGKTFLSRVLANTLNTTFMIITNLSRLEELKGIFKFAAQFERAVLLFEDIDTYVKHRSLGSGLLPTMLNALDGIEINNHLIVLCTTNDVESFDDALKDRPGRFDLILSFDSPNKELKKTMLQGFCRNKNIEDVDFDIIVERVPLKYTGAHLKELYISACILAIEKGNVDEKDNVILTTDLFITALHRIERGGSNMNTIGFGRE